MDFKINNEKYDELVAMIENGSNVKLQDAFLDYQNEKTENNERYLKHLDGMLKEAETNDKPKALITPIVGNCTLSKECLEKWMWKYAKEIEDTDNIIGLHVDTNFRKWLADNLMNEYYC